MGFFAGSGVDYEAVASHHVASHHVVIVPLFLVHLYRILVDVGLRSRSGLGWPLHSGLDCVANHSHETFTLLLVDEGSA